MLNVSCADGDEWTGSDAMISDTQLPLSSRVFEYELCCSVSDFICDNFLLQGVGGQI